jgi:hypothetical protein
MKVVIPPRRFYAILAVKLLLPIINLELFVYNAWCEADPMHKVPFILQFGKSSTTTNPSATDAITSETRFLPFW